MSTFIEQRARGRRREYGVSLVIVLVLLVATSLLGIAVLRSSAMQERMSANMRDRGVAFQAAEAALRYAQEEVLGAMPADPDDAWDVREPLATDCVVGLSVCPAGSNPVWSSVPADSFDFENAGLAAAPEYWIEYLGRGQSWEGAECDRPNRDEIADCQSPIYRVTVRSRAEGRADVMLQANITSRTPPSGS